MRTLSAVPTTQSCVQIYLQIRDTSLYRTASWVSVVSIILQRGGTVRITIYADNEATKLCVYICTVYRQSVHTHVLYTLHMLFCLTRRHDSHSYNIRHDYGLQAMRMQINAYTDMNTSVASYNVSASGHSRLCDLLMTTHPARPAICDHPVAV